MSKGRWFDHLQQLRTIGQWACVARLYVGIFAFFPEVRQPSAVSRNCGFQLRLWLTLEVEWLVFLCSLFPLGS